MNIPLGLVIASLIFVSNWKLEDGWKGIKVFETSRKEVEKRLGKPSEEDSGEVRYETDEALFLVLYSGEPCRQPYTPPTDYVIKTSVLVEGFNVQKNTVLQYSVIPKKELRLNDFEWDRKLYDRFEEPHIRSIVSYGNIENGIRFATNVMHDVNGQYEAVRTVDFDRPTQLTKKYSCESKEKTDK